MAIVDLDKMKDKKHASLVCTNKCNKCVVCVSTPGALCIALCMHRGYRQPMHPIHTHAERDRASSE